MVRAREPTYTPLIIHSDDMESKRYECLSDTANDTKVSKQTLVYAYENKRPLNTRRKGGAKVFYIKWLEDYGSLCHNIYPSWINITSSPLLNIK